MTLRDLVLECPLSHFRNSCILLFVRRSEEFDVTGSGTVVPPHSFSVMLYSRVLTSGLIRSTRFDVTVEGVTLRGLEILCPSLPLETAVLFPLDGDLEGKALCCLSRYCSLTSIRHCFIILF